jgi:ribosomal protein S18 acetylase RimI-like enzyme
MVIVIHRATLEEAPLVHRIMIEAFAEYAETLQAPSGAMTETVADVAESMARGGAILAWEGPQAVGSARFEPRDGFLSVGRVAVLPAHRRRGIAQAMMRLMETEAEAAGFQRIELGVRMSLPSNLALYASLGYETVAITPHRSGLDTVVWLAKDLSGPLQTW